MRLAVDYQSVLGQKTGIGVSTFHVIEAIERLRPEWTLLKYSTGHNNHLGALQRIYWESFQLPRLILKDKPQFLFSPGFSNPRWSSVPTILTVHDIIGLIYPNNQPLGSRFYWSYWQPSCIQKADLIIASSQSTKNDLIQRLHIAEKKINVIPLGVHLPNKEQIPARDRLRELYFLSVGTLETRKNHLQLLQAFHMYLKKGGHAQLIIVGKDGGEQKNIEAMISELSLQNHVLLKGYVEEQELIELYQKALALVNVSLYEGFGLPVLEAMKWGVSGILSNVSSLPEVGGEAALYVNPQMAHEITEALLIFEQDDALRSRLETSALNHVRHFSWQKTGEAMIQLFENFVR